MNFSKIDEQSLIIMIKRVVSHGNTDCRTRTNVELLRWFRAVVVFGVVGIPRALRPTKVFQLKGWASWRALWPTILIDKLFEAHKTTFLWLSFELKVC